jgi:hydrogenase nickel incorporation protein HypA/HybF
MVQERAQRVVGIRVSVGEFSGVEPELLRSALEQLVDDTEVRGAQFWLERVPLELSCNDCAGQSKVRRIRFQCPQCGGHNVTIVRGEDLLLESVTLEQVQA